MTLAKGGSAKSTSISNLAVLAAHAGLRVLILDTDQQGSVSVWSELRRKHHRARQVRAQHCIRGDAAAYVAHAKGHFDLVLIDTPPNLNEETEKLVRLSHLVLVTAAPHLFDIAETMRLTNWLNSRKVRPLVILTNTPADRLGEPVRVVADARRAFEAWRHPTQDRPAPLNFGLWDGHISRRLAVAYALTQGQGVIEFEPASQATEDFRRLWSHIDKALEMTL
jgi:chromosome partitioning protein